MGDKCPPCPPGSPPWMATFADMMTLLMAFFVLLFAFSSLDSQKFQTMMKAFQGALGVMDGGKTMSPEKLITDTRIQSKGTEMKFKMLSKKIQKRIDEEQSIKMIAQGKKMKEKDKDENKDEMLEETATVKITQRGVEITLGDRTLFESGRSELKQTSKNMLDSIYKEIKGIDNEIIIEGHTDNVPIKTIKYPSNWELSTNRAINVLKYLIEKDKNLKTRISAAGYAEMKPRAGNDSVEGRTKNRRVNIVILKSFEERVEEEIAKKISEGG